MNLQHLVRSKPKFHGGKGSGKPHTPIPGKGRKSILVYGPQGTGKSMHAEELCRHFDLPYLLDGWSTRDPWPIEDHIVLSNCPPPAHMRRAIPIQTALAMLKNNAPGYPF
ncbi:MULTISPECIES: ATP-binding protein [unclassified Acidovorax]|uniref:ATP-binding protein n=1 Tax=unclassified Acidovorax TaxID=2684926 RepID=UPI001C492391|nr:MULTISPECIES: ATP-binding protein [unclassified Acidovorax]MBV7427304.1 ATP-binding protein [Acidovorax sp. sif0732]MBV7448428.1 ATP-binding protein [Acidovorax sp. sif0715]